MPRKNYDVEGMSCNGCEQAVEDALADVDGVSSADADHEAGSVEVVASEETAEDDVRTAIDEAGYDVVDA